VEGSDVIRGSAVDQDLAAVADAHGVATWYEDATGRRVDVDRAVVVAVLAALGVDASRRLAVRAELAAIRRRPGLLPPTLVLRSGQRRVLAGRGVVRCEDGSVRDVDGELPGDLPVGWHRLAAGDQEVLLAVAPARLPEPPRAWGWMLQLYGLRSAGSWGMGDLADLAAFTRWAGDELAAGFVLVSPLNAATMVPPVEPSPYSPTSRRFLNPLYLRVEDTDAYAAADEVTRRRVDALRPRCDDLGDVIDHDAVWDAKRAALELLLPYAPPVDVAHDPALRDFATFCALAEQHGVDWRGWPAALRRPDASGVAAARGALGPRVAFHAWLQGLCAQQLGTARHAAAGAGMAVGIVHDLPVGVDRAGADAWALQDMLAPQVTIGAPPDAFNQHGQDWCAPPWRPDRLASTGYLAFRDMLRAVLRHADGIRVDHVAGLWRLWWIPPGEPPERGTYVRYDAEALLGLLSLEAYRAGAVVIGEDLGTVQRHVSEALYHRNMLGCAVLWFQRDPDAAGRPVLPPQRWPERAMASISTHDLPTAAGFLRAEHVRARAELNKLAGDVDVERQRAASERSETIELLREQGLLPVGATEQQIITALHALLGRTPCRLLAIAPQDVVGQVRQPNLPGTTEGYPNWRIPLPVTFEQFRTDPRVRQATEAVRHRAESGARAQVRPAASR
jgi:4-alpha-glucanotransferase